jgi:glycosyltransferase involved in cell wall biosynthesis
MLVGSLIAERGTLRKRAWIRLFERHTLERAAGIVLQSELERRELEDLGLALARTHVVPNGIDLEEAFSSDSGSAPKWVDDLVSAPYVLFLGRLSWKKGIGRLIEAIRETEGVNLVIAGNDDEALTPELKRQAGAAGVSHRVLFVGEARGATKWSLLRNARAFCLPSTSENFGIAAVEAMAVGTPTIVSPEVGLASNDAVRAGLVVAPADPESLARAIRWTLEESEALAALRETAKRVVREELCWAKIASDVREIYLGSHVLPLP